MTSGDDDLLDLHLFQEISVLTPQAFLERHRNS
jgi:predicted nucleic acid-binding protein